MASKKHFVVNTEKGLNLRTEPNKNSEVIRILGFGEKVTIDPDVETQDGWVAVKDGGFVMKEFLS